MVSCSKNSALLEGAFRRAFFSFGKPQLLFAALAMCLHAALWASLVARVPLSIQHRQTLSVHLAMQSPIQTVSIASIMSASPTPVSVPVKRKSAAVVQSDLPKSIATAPAEVPHNELTAAPPTVAAVSAGPVVGLALPQSVPAQGRRRLWAFDAGTSAPDEQALRQAQMQRETQLAMQTAREADRKKFDAQLAAALTDVPLNSACRIVIPPASAARLHCLDDRDIDSVAAVLARFGSAPLAQADTMWIAIDIAPHISATPEVTIQHSNIELALQ